MQGRGRIKYTNTLKYDPTFKDDNRTLKCEITGLNFGLDGFNQSEFKDFSAVVKLCKPTKFNASHSSIAMPRSDIRIRKVMDRLIDLGFSRNGLLLNAKDLFQSLFYQMLPKYIFFVQVNIFELGLF